MKRISVGALLAAIVAVLALVFVHAMQSAPGRVEASSGMMQGSWMRGPRWSMGAGPHRGGSLPRHHFAMMSGIPAPYAAMANPLPQTRATLERGAKVYAANCQACHGRNGEGDGPAAANLSPPPANLAWLSEMPMGRWDPFLYWTVAEGGSQFGSAMPAFKNTLTTEQIWAVTAYIQAHLPEKGT